MHTKRSMWFWTEAERRIKEKGGWVNAHHHLGSDDTLNEKWFGAISDNTPLSHKWGISDALKSDAEYLATRERRMNAAIIDMRRQGIVACRSFTNADSVVGLSEIEIARRLKRKWVKRGFTLDIAAYASRDIRDSTEQEVLREALKFPDVECIGGVPSRGRKDEFDFQTSFDEMMILGKIAFEFNKPLDMQIDQGNDPDEREARMLVLAANILRNKGYKKGINATHLISLGAYRREDWSLRDWIIQEIARLGITVAVCPDAAVGMIQKEWKDAPIHNAIAPVRRLLAAGVKVGLGIDNVSDIYEPSCRGDIREQLALLAKMMPWDSDMIEVLSDIASVNGREILGIAEEI